MIISGVMLSNTGIITDNATYVTTSFTTTGSNNWTAPANVYQVQFLIVAGGGGGGNGYDTGGGGGGGGGMVLTGFAAVTPGVTYNLVVGTGGAGGANTETNLNGSAGSSSTAFGYVALGGGAGNGSRTVDRKSTRLNSSHTDISRMPSSA